MKHARLLAITFTLLATACSQVQQPDADGGSVVGNGNDSEGVRPGADAQKTAHSIAYRNRKLKLAFSYPSNWELKEEDEKKAVTLHNRKGAAKDEVSEIRFRLLNELKGTKIKTMDELLTALTALRADQTWTKVEFVSGQEGYFTKSAPDKREKAEFYLLAENYNLLQIEYDVHTNLDGIQVAQSIIASMVIDSEPPVVREIRFDKEQVRPGETVTMTIVVDDLIAGVDPSSVVTDRNTMTVEGFSRLGYEQEMSQMKLRSLNDPTYLDQREQEKAPDDARMYGFVDKAKRTGLTFLNQSDVDRVHRQFKMESAFPIDRPLKQISANVFQYEFQVPERAQPGRISLIHLRISDKRANETILSVRERFVEDFSEDLFVTSLDSNHFFPSFGATFPTHKRGSLMEFYTTREAQSDIRRVSFEIINDGDADREVPVLRDAYFDWNTVASPDTKQRLYLEIEDDSEIRSHAYVLLRAYRGREMKTEACGSSYAPLQSDDERHFVEIDMNDCYKTLQNKDHYIFDVPFVVVLEQLDISDVLGNVVHYFPEDRENLPGQLEGDLTPRLPNIVRFQVLPPTN